MTELRGTFDAEKTDWSKMFGETPKSIDDIGVIGLHDKTIDKKREFVAIDRVLEIIDEVYEEESVSADDYAIGIWHACNCMKKKIKALQGGERE